MDTVEGHPEGTGDDLLTILSVVQMDKSFDHLHVFGICAQIDSRHGMHFAFANTMVAQNLVMLSSSDRGSY